MNFLPGDQNLVTYFEGVKAEIAQRVANGEGAVKDEKYRLFFALNPLTAIIEGTRASLVLDRAPDWPLTGLAAAMSVGLLVGSYALFKALDRYFADVL